MLPRGIRQGSKISPFSTYTNSIYPRTIEDALDWAEWFWSRFANYRTSVVKLVSYFVSGYTVTQKTDRGEEVDNDAVRQFETLLEDAYDMRSDIVQFGLELVAMGNVFVSADPVFSRQLYCPADGCGWIMNLKKLRAGRDYKWTGSKFTGVCPQCGRHVDFRFKDVRAQDSKGARVRFVYRSPRDMRIQFNRLSGTYKYYYKIPEDVVGAIRRGDPVYLEDSPAVYLEAVEKGSTLVEFPEDRFFAMRTHTLTELDRLYKGWGVPLFMSSFNDYIQMQHLYKFNEAVIMDYIAPIRMLSPAPQALKGGTDDPNRVPMSMGQWKRFMTEGVSRVKENPTTWLISPVPAQYQMLGGEAKQLTPVDLLEWQSTQALANQGIPQEMKQTSFQVVAPTMGLRMFERQHIQTAKDFSAYTKWKAQVIADAHGIEDMDCSLDVTSFVEDDMNKNILLQLAQGGMVAKEHIFKRLNLDYEQDAKMRIAEMRKEEELQQAANQEQEGKQMTTSVMPPGASVGIQAAQANIDAASQAQQPAQPGAPSAPAGPGAAAAPGAPQLPFGQSQSGNATLESITVQAQDIAQQLYTMPYPERRRELINLKNTNETLHAMVKAQLEGMRSQVASDAVAQSQQPQQG